jgi:hypothetical protein
MTSMESIQKNTSSNSLCEKESAPVKPQKSQKDRAAQNAYSSQTNAPNTSTFGSSEVSYQAIDRILESEKQKNKADTWSKLDKTVKLQKLHTFAEKYGREHGIPAKEIKNLKMFFVGCLENNKLHKTKDLVYNKDTREITSIPALYLNANTRNFSLKITDAKRISTLKSLTPKRITDKNMVSICEDDMVVGAISMDG